MTRIVQPGSTIGVLGSGQLGRMFAMAARHMGYRIHVLSPDRDSPTGHVSDQEIVADYDDLDAIQTFAQQVDVVTFEFENVSSAATEVAERFAPVRPSGSVLHVAQDRLREKSRLQQAGFPVTPFRAVSSLEELKSAAADLGLPAVLKSSRMGYDGKGQAMLREESQLAAAWASLGDDGMALEEFEAVLEKYIEFDCEVSVIGARSPAGEFVAYPPFENSHERHILDVSISPARIATKTADEAVQIARDLFAKFQVEGVLCIEFFVTSDGGLLINEIAPRPHNSGHLTIDAHETSQFEQQVRAVCGLPLGSSRQHSPAAMANLLGDVWNRGEPDWKAALANPSVKLHLYGKHEPRDRRKMGHLTALAESAESAATLVTAARRRLISTSAEEAS